MELSSPSDMTFAVPLLSCTTNHPQNAVTWVSAETLCMNLCVRLISGGLAMRPPISDCNDSERYHSPIWWLMVKNDGCDRAISLLMYYVQPGFSHMIVTIQGVSEDIQDPLMLLKVEHHCFFVLLVKSCFVSLFSFLKPLQKQMRKSLLMGGICVHKQGDCTCKISYLPLSQS